MALLFKVFLILLSLSAIAEIELPLLTTKQDIRNIRYISSDGKFTYYQRSNGSLQFSTNYKVTEIIKLAPQTHYNLIVSPAKRYILVEAYENYHNYFAARASAKIYLIKYGTSEIKEIGMGKAISTHLDDQWFSYYNSFAHTLTLQSTVSSTLKHSIKLANIKNPYFIPQAFMLNSDTYLYTDINKEGLPGILRYQLNASDINLVHKTTSQNVAIEMCYNKQIYLMTYALDALSKKTTIQTIDKKTYQLNPNPLYESKENDIGSLVCDYDDKSLFFVKTFRSSEGKITYDAVKQDLKNKKITRLSEILFATSVVRMDKMLLLPYQDKFYILEGENILTEADRLLKDAQEQGDKK